MPIVRFALPVIALCLAAGLAFAEATVTGSVAGRELYAAYCAGCHGLDGRGGGPEAAGLAVKPADLTRLHERFGSPLQRERVAAFIDGREDIAAHGRREMPVWGERFFEGDPGPPRGVESSKRRTIELLIDHLQVLQGQKEARLAR
jgi:mono/diheme cytochrome c family protein